MKNICCILLVVFCSSCSIQGLTSGYKNQGVHLNIVFLDSIDNVVTLDPKTIYSINGETLKKEISKHQKSLIYFWGINCTSKYCIPLHAVQSYSDENDMQLFVVIDYYDRDMTTVFGETKNPLLSVDQIYYKTNFVHKYSTKFKNDLVGYELNDSISWNRYYYFEGDEFIKVKRTIMEF